MKSQASKTLSLKKLSILELNSKQLKNIIGGTVTLNQEYGYMQPLKTVSQNTVSTDLCNDNTSN